MKASTPIASVTIPSACYTEREHHIEIARALLAKGNERLVLGRAVPSIERVHVGKLDDDDPFRFPMPALGLKWTPDFGPAA